VGLVRVRQTCSCLSLGSGWVSWCLRLHLCSWQALFPLGNGPSAMHSMCMRVCCQCVNCDCGNQAPCRRKQEKVKQKLSPRQEARLAQAISDDTATQPNGAERLGSTALTTSKRKDQDITTVCFFGWAAATSGYGAQLASVSTTHKHRRIITHILTPLCEQHAMSRPPRQRYPHGYHSALGHAPPASAARSAGHYQHHRHALVVFMPVVLWLERLRSGSTCSLCISPCSTIHACQHTE
jgi:hypothetical protein